MKISKVKLNGTDVLINDPDALQLPEEVQVHDGDMLVYDEQLGGFKFIQKSNVVEVENGIVKGSQKLAKSGDVYNAVQNAGGVSVKEVKLKVTYNTETHKIKFQVDSNSPNQLQANVSLLLLSINTSYNSNLEELRISNIVDVLILTPSLNQIEKYIPIYPEDRTFYFVAINNNQNVQVCTLDATSINVPGSSVLDNNQITASVVAPGDNNGVQAIRFTAVHAVDVPIECRVNCPRVTGDPYAACYAVGTIGVGESSVLVPIVATYTSRSATLSIVPQQASEQYTYLLANNSISVPGPLQINVISGNADQNRTILTFAGEQNKLPTSNVKINISFPRSGTSPFERNTTINQGDAYGQFNYNDLSWSGPSVYFSIDESTSRDSVYVYVVGQPDSMELITNVNGSGQPW